MNRLGEPLLIVSMMMGSVVVGSGLLRAPSAWACSIAEQFTVTDEHLADGDFNEPDSQLAQDYREWTGDDSASIQIMGVYVYETVYAVDVDGDWSRGSLSVPMEIWGKWPANTSPKTIQPQDRSGEPPDNCGWGSSGRPMGTRDYSLVSTEAQVSMVAGDGAKAGLTAAFGVPDTAPRDRSLEQDLIAQLDASRRTNTRLFVGVGVAAVAAAAAVMYTSRRRRGMPDTQAPSPGRVE